ncbi:MAG: peroxidase family protein [Amaricoccus sp.]|uniref:hypothetical protein n=1 Tax=Amaricoccus sp. TaxID=1872485 RepID=UPI0039E2ED27
MPELSVADPILPNLFGAAQPSERFAGLDPRSADGAAELAAIAARIGATRRPGAKSDIPAGVTYLTQLVVLDLDFPTREAAAGGPLLDLGVLYGDGPKHSACCYQVPFQAGVGRHLLRIGRTRPTASSPAWGATRDLPRAACPNLDARPVESRSEVLVPDSASDSNLLLAQVQVLWALLHNAVAATLSETRRPELAFELARRVTCGIYRDVVRRDVLGSWLLPALRERYARPVAAAGLHRVPVEFTAGVGRLGHGLVREIYTLNTQTQVAGLRTLLRHTSTGRPFEMPLTEDWLVDFSGFFAVGDREPQRARALGPHVARPFATGTLPGGDAGTLVLRDLLACTTGEVRSVGSLLHRADAATPGLFTGRFGEDGRWQAALTRWLADAGLPPAAVERLSQDPPLTLFLMLEAEADADGKSLGTLGSVIMGETLAAALGPDPLDAAADAARALVFRDGAPASMAAVVRFLQGHYRFAEGARLHALDAADQPDSAAAHPHSVVSGGFEMLDTNAPARPAIPRIEVADYIEMGRLVAQWSAEPATRPKTIQELREQLDGVAVVPDRITSIEFTQSRLDHLVLPLPPREMIEDAIDRMSDPMSDGRYPLPQFYADHCRPGFGPVMTPLDTLLARVGDHIIAQCR